MNGMKRRKLSFPKYKMAKIKMSRDGNERKTKNRNPFKKIVTRPSASYICSSPNDRPVNCTNFTRARFCLLETNRKRSYTVIESTVQFDFAKNHPSTTHPTAGGCRGGVEGARAQPSRSWSPLWKSVTGRYAIISRSHC